MLVLAQMTALPDDVSYGWLFVKTIVAMAIIIGLALFIMRYLAPKLSLVRRFKDSQIQILDRQPLEPRKSVYIVQVDDKKLALGVSEHNINLLCEWPKD